MVPKLLHQIIGPGTTDIIKKCLSSWRVLEDRGFKIKYWDDVDLEIFLTKFFPFALQPFLSARNHAEASDIARYLIIFKFGGVYMDWDVQLLNIRKFIRLMNDNPYGFLLRDPPNRTLASEAFSAPKGEEYLEYIVKEISTIFKSGMRSTVKTPQYSGPYRMRDALENCETKQSIIPVKQVFAYDYSEIRDMPKREITQPLIHYWVHSWL